MKNFFAVSDLRKEIPLMLLVKVGALFVLWSLFFAPEHEVHVDGQALGEHLFTVKETQ